MSAAAFLHYRSFFQSKQRVQLAIPMTGGKIFAEWGSVVSLIDDLLTIRLSRDQLPTGANLRMGNMLELKTSRDGSFYACSSLIVEEYSGLSLIVRLIGTPELDDQRQYFRVDVFLPFKYSIPCSQDPDKIRAEWLAMRELRITNAQQQASFIPFPHEGLCPTIQHSSVPWDELLPVAANISGGGVKVNIPGKLNQGDLIDIELYLPASPPWVIDIVGKVISSAPVDGADDEEEIFNTALSYHFIHERDRDAIIAYIASEELERLRQAPRPAEASSSRAKALPPWLRLAYRIAAVVLSLILLYGIARSMISYREGHEKNEIESTFETGIRKYMEKFK